MKINLDTKIYDEVDIKKMKRNLRDAFKEKDSDVKVHTPISPSKKRISRKRRALCHH